MTCSFFSCLFFKVIQQAWPFIGQYLEKLLTETIAPSIRGSSTHLQTLSFTKIDFGGKVIHGNTHTHRYTMNNVPVTFLHISFHYSGRLKEALLPLKHVWTSILSNKHIWCLKAHILVKARVKFNVNVI